MQKFFVLQVVRFVLVGIINTAVGQSVTILSYFSLGNIFTANIIGYSVGLSISYFLNSRWVFGPNRHLQWLSFFQFLLVVMVSFLINIAVIYGLVRLGCPYVFAQLSGAAAYTLTSFLFFKLWVFR